MTMFLNDSYFPDTSTRPSSIDMLNPDQTCERLALSPDHLRELVNRGELAAYDLGEGIRFRSTHVEALAKALIAS